MDQWNGPRLNKKKKKGPDAQRAYNKTLNILPNFLDPKEILWLKVSFHMDYIYMKLLLLLFHDML
jgi:hypothetical protein